MSHKKANDLVAVLEPQFAKAPALPKNAVEALVKVFPILALIFGVLGLLAAISGLGLLTVFSPLAVMGGAEGMSSYGSGFVAALFLLVTSVLLLAAYPSLQKRKAKGWVLLFWAEVANLVSAVLSLSLGGVVGVIIGLYILFQIKSHYK